MDREQWNEDRMLWRWGKHDSVAVNDASAPFEDLSEETRAWLGAQEGIVGRPVLMFGEKEGSWTVLTTLRLMSFHTGEVHTCDLEDIVSVEAVVGEGECRKREAEFARVETEQGEILAWAPMGSPLFALVSVLMMFPLSYPFED